MENHDTEHLLNESENNQASHVDPALFSPAEGENNLVVTDEMEDVEFDAPQEETNTAEQETTYKFTEIDCLDEDDPITGQQYVLLSFISPEGVMNCKIRGVKVRGVYDSIEKANKMAAKLNKDDKYHSIFVGQVGKWLPWDPSAKQVEEEKYGNDKLNNIMRKAHESEMKNQVKDLNELVGRHKENMELKDKQHEKRVAEKIKQGAADYDDNEEQTQEPEKENKSSSESDDDNDTLVTHDEKRYKKANVNLQNLNRNREALRERIHKKLEEAKQKKQGTVDQEQDLETKKKLIFEESKRVAEKGQNIESLKQDKDKIETNLQKMKEMYLKQMKDQDNDNNESE
jgi:Family of unknown function (DUF5832)